MTFDSNMAQTGAAMHIKCDNYEICGNTIINSSFINNQANEKGGAIYYDFRRPQIINTYFDNNTAIYGPDIGSYAVRVAQEDAIDDHIMLIDVASGLRYDAIVRLLLVDYDNQVMNLENTSQIKILPVTQDAKLKGFDSSALTMGVAEFDGLQFEYYPGATNVKYIATSDLIDLTKVGYLDLPTNNTITVSFRYCKPGEIIVDNTT